MRHLLLACIQAGGVAVGGLLPLAAQAAEINLGPTDAIAIDQPRVIFTITEPGTDTEVGPVYSNIGLLDTGANGVLLANLSYDLLNPDPHYPYEPARRADNSIVTYQESGVSGFETLTVYRPYDVQFAGLSGMPVQLQSDVTLFGSSTLDLGGLPAIVGMPTMAGRVVSMDPRPLTQTNTDFLATQFHTDRPAAVSPHTFHVNLPMLPYEHAGTDPNHPDDPKPTFADLPLIDVSTSAKGTSLGQRLLLDTGAQTSIISVAAAAGMGIDISDGSPDVLDHLPVGGIGGTVNMPLVRLDRLVLPTIEGDELVYENVVVGVLDIIGIDGVFGMNLLVDGYGDLVGIGDGSYGSYGQIVLDFRDPDTGVMRLDLNPQYIPEPTHLALLVGGVAAILRRRRLVLPPSHEDTKVHEEA